VAGFYQITKSFIQLGCFLGLILVYGPSLTVLHVEAIGPDERRDVDVVLFEKGGGGLVDDELFIEKLYIYIYN